MPQQQSWRNELGRFLRGEPIRARPVSVIEKGWRWSKRNPINSGLGAGLVVVLVAFIAYSLISASRIRLEARHARLAEQQSRSELWQSYLAQAHAQRLSGQAGQRYASLDVIGRATAIRPSLELRNEAIAALALPDARLTRTWRYNDSRLTLAYSASLERFAVQGSTAKSAFALPATAWKSPMHPPSATRVGLPVLLQMKNGWRSMPMRTSIMFGIFPPANQSLDPFQGLAARC